MTKIEWTDATLNAFVGCSIVSAGCTNCYAMRQAYRLEHAFHFPTYQGTTRKVNGKPVWSGQVNRASDAKIAEPRRWRDSRMIFVNSMSDFWHPNARDEWRAEVLELMRATPQHAYQVLTKRPEMILPTLKRMGVKRLPDNLWLGCTLEDHRVAERAVILAKVPARVRFLSVEPMTAEPGKLDLRGIHWVIGGGESGFGARPMKAQWARDLRDQAVSAGAAFFWKQYGIYTNNPLVTERRLSPAEAERLDPPGNGKGGGLLDGKLWRQFPEKPGGPVQPW